MPGHVTHFGRRRRRELMKSNVLSLVHVPVRLHYAPSQRLRVDCRLSISRGTAWNIVIRNVHLRCTTSKKTKGKWNDSWLALSNSIHSFEILMLIARIWNEFDCNWHAFVPILHWVYARPPSNQIASGHRNCSSPLVAMATLFKWNLIHCGNMATPMRFGWNCTSEAYFPSTTIVAVAVCVC